MERIAIIYIAFLKFFYCQVCIETKSVLVETPEVYRFTYIEPYEACMIFCSVKTRTAVNTTVRIVQRYENYTVNTCCPGYTKDQSYTGDGLFCTPICDPTCQNGYCSRPNECACDPGYALDPLSPHTCKPLCFNGCLAPDCIETTIPECSRSDSKNTYPDCTDPCINGTCVALNTCACLPGYFKRLNTCEPYCSSCDHGSCIAPELCQCDQGWQRHNGICQPVCTKCKYGTCKSPEECDCYNGYFKSDDGICEPHCSNGCHSGICVSPDTCVCNDGWYKDRSGECRPHCEISCGKGTCVAPGECTTPEKYLVNASIEESPQHAVNKGDDIIVNAETNQNTKAESLSCDCSICSNICTTNINNTYCDFVYDTKVNGNVTGFPNISFTLNSPQGASVTPNTSKFQNTAGISIYWIYGIIALTIIILVIVSSVIIVKKYNKKKRMKTINITGTPESDVVFYTI